MVLPLYRFNRDKAWYKDEAVQVQRYAYFRVIKLQWNLSVTTTSIIKFITCDLFINVY